MHSSQSLSARRLKTLLAGVWAASLIACSSGSTSPTPDFSGTYVLATIDGSPLPVTTAIDGNTRYAAQSGNTILRTDGSFTKNHFTAVYNSANVLTQIVPYVYNGMYSVVGTHITFNYPANATEGATSVDGEIADGVLVQVSIGKTWRFVRQS